MIQILDHGFLELVETWGSDEAIVRAARMSTNKGFLGWGGVDPCVKCDGRGGLETESQADIYCSACRGTGKKPGDEKLLRYLWEHKHHSPFEFAGMIVEVQAPIFVFREWMRHRVQSFNEMSARYTPLPDVNYVPSLERLMLGSDGKNKQAGTVADAEVLTEEYAHRFRQMLHHCYEEMEGLYQEALRRGVPKELARVHLPVGRYSRMRASANLRNWLAFLTLRMAPEAQWEIRCYARAVHDILKERFPRTLELFDENTGH